MKFCECSVKRIYLKRKDDWESSQTLYKRKSLKIALLFASCKKIQFPYFSIYFSIILKLGEEAYEAPEALEKYFI